MMRIGRGCQPLNVFLNNNDPCRGKTSQKQWSIFFVIFSSFLFPLPLFTLLPSISSHLPFIFSHLPSLLLELPW